MDLQPLEYRKQFIIKLIYLINQLHNLGVIYVDDFFTNVSVSSDGDPYLIDFGNSFFINSPPKLATSIAGKYQVSAHDVFNLLTLVNILLSKSFPSNESWKSMIPTDLLPMISWNHGKV